MGHIVLDTDGEVVLRLLQRQVVEHGLDLGGSGVLGGQAVTAGVDQRTVGVVDVGGADILVQRLTNGTGFLHAVQNSDLLHRLGHGGKQMLGGEGTEQVYLQEAHLLALGVQVVDDLLCAAGHGAHGHNDALGVGCTVVVEQMVLAAGQLADLGHVVLHHVGQVGVVGIVGLAQLEVDIGVIHQRAHAGILRIQGIGTELGQSVIVHQLGVLVVVQHVDLLDLVAGTEAVKEVQEGDAGLDGAQVGHGGQIGGLLDAAAGQHGKAGGADGHYIAVVAENAQTVGGHQTGSHVEHAGQQFACDLEHIGDHQHQALRGGIGAGQSACLQRAVNRA